MKRTTRPTRSLGLLCVIAGTVVGVWVGVCGVALAAPGPIVLRDTPPRNTAGETPRWLGRTGAATAAVRRVLIDKTLRSIEANEVEFLDGVVKYRDGAGRAATVAMGDLVAVLPPVPGHGGLPGQPRTIEWREIADVATGPTGRVELVDGQVIPGVLVAAPAKGESIAWSHGLLGLVHVPIEDIERLVFRGGEGNALAADATSDVVVFTNGDQARGVIESIAIGEDVGAAGGELKMDIAGKPTTTSLERVAMVTLANPKKPMSGVVAWLRDGTVVAGKSSEASEKGLVLSDGSLGGERSIEMPWDEVVGLNLDAGHVVPLSSLVMVEVQAAEGREWITPPKVEAAAGLPGGVGDVELSGPIRVRWTLPVNTGMLAVRASLPPSARAMGDCVLVVECAGQTVRERLHGERPTFDVRLTLPEGSAGTLSIAIESGEGGTIQDRVLLERGLVLVR